MPHPATQIVIWMVLAVIVQTLSAITLTGITILLMLIAYRLHDRRFFTLLRRSRWILFSLLLVYSFATPGQALWELPYVPQATLEGLLDGALQLGRLVSMLAGLSILLTLLPKEHLIGGLYVLAYPLGVLGISRERIAVRLALTLHYAESAMRDTASDWKLAIENALQPGAGGGDTLALHTQTIARIDVLLWVLCGALLLGIKS
ncbi:MAG: hypothetical protein WC742_00330 [Gallionellaceae bacterium]|jgi:energy-coupling factor transport system permease protein